MKLLKLESGSRSGVNAGKRNSVSRARCKRQSKDLIEWMKETAMAVENRSKNAGRRDRFPSAEPDFSARAWPFCAMPGKKTEWKAHHAIGVLPPMRSPVCSHTMPLSSESQLLRWR